MSRPVTNSDETMRKPWRGGVWTALLAALLLTGRLFAGGGSPYDSDAPWGTPHDKASSEDEGDSQNSVAAPVTHAQPAVVTGARPGADVDAQHAFVELSDTLLVQGGKSAPAKTAVKAHRAGEALVQILVPKGGSVFLESIKEPGTAPSLRLQGVAQIVGAHHVLLRAPFSKGEFWAIVVVSTGPRGGALRAQTVPMGPGDALDVSRLRDIAKTLSGRPGWQGLYGHVVLVRRSFDLESGQFVHQAQGWVSFQVGSAAGDSIQVHTLH